MTNGTPCQVLLHLGTDHNLGLIGILMQISTSIQRAPSFSISGLLVLVAAEQPIWGQKRCM